MTNYGYDHGEDEERGSNFILKWFAIIVVLGFLVFIGLVVYLTSAQAAIPEDLAVRALVGEAGGQSEAELYAHACALRNRDSLKGVYGLQAKHLATEPQSTFKRARNAWLKASNGPDIVNGRTEWRSDYDLKKIALWAPNKKIRHMAGLKDPLRIGSTTFYRRTHGKQR